MSTSLNWKAILLGTATGIALVQIVRTVLLPMFYSSSPLGLIDASYAIRLSYVNIGLGLLCATVGGYVGARLARARPVFHGFLAGSVQALVALGAIMYAPRISLDTVTILLLTAVFGAIGGYIASHARVS